MYYSKNVEFVQLFVSCIIVRKFNLGIVLVICLDIFVPGAARSIVLVLHLITEHWEHMGTLLEYEN